MVDFPVYGLDMTPHLANRHNSNLNNINTNASDQQNPVILNNGTWSPWKRTRKQSTTNDNLYDLYAVCYHHGTDLETGHYTAACKNPYDNQWYLYDDAKVTNLSQQSNDVSSELVNNSAYILFYQKRNGIYVSSSSNTSSAASTSSVGSSGDHWVSKMPKFTLPKTYKPPEKKLNSNENENKLPSVTNAEINSQIDGEDKNLKSTLSAEEVKVKNSEDESGEKNDIHLRNEDDFFKNNKDISQRNSDQYIRNTDDHRRLYADDYRINTDEYKRNIGEYRRNIDENRRSADVYRRNTGDFKKTSDEVMFRNSQNTLYSSQGSVRKENKSTSTNENALIHSSVTNSRLSSEKKPIYTTSIYINSSGNVDITTTCERSPVLSLHRVNGVSEEDVKINFDQNSYDFIDEPDTCLLSERAFLNERTSKVSNQCIIYKIRFLEDFNNYIYKKLILH